jgi:hypothetical protein
LAPVYDNASCVRVGRVVQHLNGFDRTSRLGTQIQQLTQLGVFLRQLFNLLQTLGLRDGTALEKLGDILRILQVFQILSCSIDPLNGFLGQP